MGVIGKEFGVCFKQFLQFINFPSCRHSSQVITSALILRMHKKTTDYTLLSTCKSERR